MRSPFAWLVVVAAIAAAGAGGYWLGHRGAGTKGPSEPAEGEGAGGEVKPVATVSVVPLRRGFIQETIIAYGTVVAPPSEVRVVSVPFESRVTKILVAPGQVVEGGASLGVVEASAATVLAVQEARNALAAAQRDLELVRQRYEQKLATNTELYAAQNALQSAQARLQSLEQGGAAGPRQLKAEAPGVVSKVDVQAGQVVPAGNPLVEVAAQTRIEVKLGAEPEDVPYLKPGQAVQLHRTDDPGAQAVEGKIRLIAQRVDPITRLVDVMVSLPPDARLLLESFVTAQTTRASADALVAPRDAVLPGEEGAYTLFTVKDGKAVKHTVRIGVENDQEVQIIADDLKEGEPVVVVGNYELDDGMLVQAQPAPPRPPATEPAGTESVATEPAAGQRPETARAATQPAATSPATQTGGER